MMNGAKVLAASLAAAGVLVVSGNVSSANSTEEYRDSMSLLLPAVDEWMIDVNAMASAAAAKPTQENIAAVEQLSVTGAYILDDLRGTAGSVPEPLMVAHWRLADSLGSLVTYSESFGENPVDAANLIRMEAEVARPVHEKIMNFLTRFNIIGSPGAAEPQVDL